jgi:hypothetical protein
MAPPDGPKPNVPQTFQLHKRLSATNEKPRTGAGLELSARSRWYHARESSDSPRLNAFWRVAPSVRFNVRAMLAARVFFLAVVFNMRTSVVVHARRFDFLAI